MESTYSVTCFFTHPMNHGMQNETSKLHTSLLPDLAHFTRLLGLLTLGANVMQHNKNLRRSHENKTKAQLLIMLCIVATAGMRVKIQICL